MIRRRTPLRRSTKPLKRTPLKRGTKRIAHRSPKHVARADADGIERRVDKLTNEQKEFCRTPAAKERRRREIFDAAHGRCQKSKCRMKLDFDAHFMQANSMHWHHKVHRSKGGDDSRANGRALCRDCHLVGEHGQF